MSVFVRFGNIQILEDQCRQDGTRLAKAINSGQTQALVDWLNTKEPWLSENSMVNSVKNICLKRHF